MSPIQRQWDYAGDPQLTEPDLPRTAKVRQRALRTGWTTGTCASAAAKAAVTALEQRNADQPVVEVALPSGRRVRFATERVELADDGQSAEAVVVKDAGDDPDVTDGAHLTATARWRDRPGLDLDGGEGVGTVTKPGLGLTVGAPAINDTPRRMIQLAVGEVVDLGDRGVRVVISVPDGERMARKTTNRRLGIVGGISILGTTGIVRPFSTASWRASVVQAVHVMAAQGEKDVVLCTGGRTENGARTLMPDLPEVCFVEVGDFTGAALRAAVDDGLERVVFVGMIGKLTKLASGLLMTHYTRSRVDVGLLAAITEPHDADTAAEVARGNSGRHVYELWESAGLLGRCGDELCGRVQEVLQRQTAELGRPMPAEVAMVNFSGRRCTAATVPGWAA